MRVDERRITNSTNVKNMNKSKRFSIGEDQKSIFKRKGKTIDRNANVK
jgi:hypothetical protein